jgi:hypothetical protein
LSRGHGIVYIINSREGEVPKDAALIDGAVSSVVLRGDAVFAIDVERMGRA